jgi:hypothetical protein
VFRWWLPQWDWVPPNACTVVHVAAVPVTLTLAVVTVVTMLAVVAITVTVVAASTVVTTVTATTMVTVGVATVTTVIVSATVVAVTLVPRKHYCCCCRIFAVVPGRGCVISAVARWRQLVSAVAGCRIVVTANPITWCRGKIPTRRRTSTTPWPSSCSSIGRRLPLGLRQADADSAAVDFEAGKLSHSVVGVPP